MAKRRNLREATKIVGIGWGRRIENVGVYYYCSQPRKASNLGGNRLGTLLVTRERGGRVAAARPLSCKVGNRLPPPPPASATGSRRCYCPEQQQLLLLLLQGDCASEGERESSRERRDFLLLLLRTVSCRVVSCGFCVVFVSE